MDYPRLNPVGIGWFVANSAGMKNGTEFWAAHIAAVKREAISASAYTIPATTPTVYPEF
jgi:hypothetical protein